MTAWDQQLESVLACHSDHAKVSSELQISGRGSGLANSYDPFTGSVPQPQRAWLTRPALRCIWTEREMRALLPAVKSRPADDSGNAEFLSLQFKYHYHKLQVDHCVISMACLLWMHQYVPYCVCRAPSLSGTTFTVIHLCGYWEIKRPQEPRDHHAVAADAAHGSGNFNKLSRWTSSQAGAGISSRRMSSDPLQPKFS